jgi:hypothetical protein
MLYDTDHFGLGELLFKHLPDGVPAFDSSLATWRLTAWDDKVH